METDIGDACQIDRRRMAIIDDAFIEPFPAGIDHAG